MRDRHPRRRSLAVTAALAVVALGASACSTVGASQNGSAGMTGTGSIILVSPDDRKAAPELSGTTLDGSTLDVADYRGEVVVVNYWAPWCGPCRGEAPDLVAASKKLGSDVPFVGLMHSGDSEANAEAYNRTFHITYPTFVDDDGKLLLAFYGVLVSLPSTVVLDTEGRIAAIVPAPVTTTTLVDLVHDVQRQA